MLCISCAEISADVLLTTDDERAIIEKVRKDLAFLQGDVLGVLIFRSWATGERHEMSDIDICIVAFCGR